MKKIFAAVMVLVLIIPALLSIKLYNDTLKEEKNREVLGSISVTDDAGTVFSFENKESAEFKHLKDLALLDEDSLTTRDELIEMSEESRKSDTNPKCVRFRLVYKTNRAEYPADIFVTDVERNGSFVAYLAADGKVLCFDEDRQGTLLSLDFTYTLNEAAKLPVLNVGEFEVKPLTIDWKVKNAAGETVDVDFPEGSVVDAGAFNTSFEFSISPDDVSVKAYNENKEELLSGKLDVLSSYNPSRSGKITVEINAVWYQKDGVGYFGSATYSFTSEVSAKPVFMLNAKETQPGGTLLLSCLNIPSEKITVAAIGERSLPLYKKGRDLYAIVAFPYDTAPGEYTISVFVGSEENKIPVTVNKKDFPKTATVPTRLMSKDAFLAATNAGAIQEFNTLLETVAKGGSDELFFDGNLLDYQKSLSLYKGYGLYVPYQSSGETVRNNGVFFSAKAGSVIQAMGDGKVCAVGSSAYLGKYIVIDHGYGLRSWYATLGDTTVEVGDPVKKGEKIATSGKGGIAPDGNILVMVTVDNIPVSPYAFWEETRRFES